MEGLSDKTLRQELLKVEPESANDSFTIAMALNSFLEKQNRNPQQVLSVNRIAQEASVSCSPQVKDKFVRTLRQELKKSVNVEINSK